VSGLARKVDFQALVAGVLAGETRAVAKMMSEAEAGFDAGRAAMAEIYGKIAMIIMLR